MEAGVALITIIMAIICVFCGIEIGKRIYKPKGVKGSLNVVYDDQSNEPFLYLEAYVPVTEIAQHKSVILDVNILR